MCCCMLAATYAATPKAEYWIDQDPGIGDASSVPLSNGIAQKSISTSGLSYGWHTIGLRAYRGGNWSQTYTRLFYVPDPQSLSEDLTAVECWIDNDPGFGLAAPMPFSPQQRLFTLNLEQMDTLSSGFHRIGMRVRQGSRWSETYIRDFLVPDPQSLSEDLTAVECWIDNDPGFGLATPMPFSPQQRLFTINLQQMDTLPEGLHRIGIRVRQGSRWSETYIRDFVNVQLPAQMTIEEVVAYWDGDTTNLIQLSYTQHDTFVQATDVQLSMDALSYGPHKLYLRATADGIRSVTLSYDVYKDELLGDVNEDGVVNVMDATMLIGAYLQGTTDQLNANIADVNRDGVINVMDATEIINIYLHNY